MSAARLRQAGALRPALLRSVRWQPVPVAALAAGLLLLWRLGSVTTEADAVWLLRTVAVLLAVGLAFALDDRSRATLASLPTPLWWRSGAQLVVAGTPVVLAWGAGLGWVTSRVPDGPPALGLSLEALAMATLAVASASALSRWRDVPEPGVVVAPAVLTAAVLLPLLPTSIALAVPPGGAWGEAHLRWALVLGTAAAVLGASWRDPASRVRA